MDRNAYNTVWTWNRAIVPFLLFLLLLPTLCRTSLHGERVRSLSKLTRGLACHQALCLQDDYDGHDNSRDRHLPKVVKIHLSIIITRYWPHFKMHRRAEASQEAWYRNREYLCFFPRQKFNKGNPASSTISSTLGVLDGLVRANCLSALRGRLLPPRRM